MNDSRHGTPPAPPEPDSVCLPGPWRHRLVSTNGIHLHTADLLPHNWEETHPPNELPPLVLLIHGYGENWWTWHNQLVPLSRAGYHAMAVDLRGYGDSDKPPRGYDLTTAANDMAGLVRATGHRNVTVVGHGLGGTVGWTMARMFRSGVTTLIAVDAPHPLTQRIDYMKQAFTHATTVGPFLSAQIPRLPEWRMQQPHWIEDYISHRTYNNWVDTPEGQEALHIFSDALRIRHVSYCANEYLRWMGRSRLRADGIRYNRKMTRRLALPVVAFRGEYDPVVSKDVLAGCKRYTENFTIMTVPQCGFYPQLENPQAFSTLLLQSLSGSPARINSSDD